MKPFFIHTRHFPGPKYHAITLFPFVFYNGRPLDAVDVRHETVHIWQQLALLIIPFYLLYFVFWLYGLVKFRNQQRAYMSIPFECSAYYLETRKELKPIMQAFDWVKYLSTSTHKAQ